MPICKSESNSSFHSVLSGSCGSLTSNSFSYYTKQQDLLKAIQETTSLLHSMTTDHRSDRCPIVYPKSKPDFSSSRGPGSGSVRSRSLSAENQSKRFQIIGLASTRMAATAQSPHSNDLSLLDESSLGRLLAGRLEECREYLERMAARVRDRTSKVMVTGDLNGGKSTLINALLRDGLSRANSLNQPVKSCNSTQSTQPVEYKNLLPIDQQPCTQAFCEVVPVVNGTLSVQAISDIERYSPEDRSSYDTCSVEKMQTMVQEEDCPYKWFRVTVPLGASPASFLTNELVQVSLIDSPGLNTDLFKTIDLFTRQEEIDVVVFVVNAANHLTLSAREFLETAGRDKTMIFVIVNKFDEINNKEKCRKIILQQISEVLPATYNEADYLIHFVSAKQHLLSFDPTSCVGLIGDSSSLREPIEQEGFDYEQAFAQMESCLSDFILTRRTESKLLPAKTFMTNLLGDLDLLTRYNEQVIAGDLHQITKEINDVLTPCYEELVKREAPLTKDLLEAVTEASGHVYTRAQSIVGPQLETALVKLAMTAPWDRSRWGWGWKARILEQAGLIAQEHLVGARRSGLEIVRNCREYLRMVARGHASHLYGSDGSDYDELHGDCQSMDVCPLTNVGSLIDIFAIVKRALLGMAVGLGSIGAAGMLLVQSPMLPLAINLSRHRFVLLSALIGLSAVSLIPSFLMTVNLESMARDRMADLLRDHYGRVEWRHQRAMAIEAECHGILSSCSGQLLTKFQAALHQQRQLRAEKDLVKGRLGARLNTLRTYKERIMLVRSRIDEIVI